MKVLDDKSASMVSTLVVKTVNRQIRRTGQSYNACKCKWSGGKKALSALALSTCSKFLY